jgi:hypothetical protein
MEWITIVDWPGGTLSTFEELSTQRGSNPDGLLARYVGETGDALRIVAVWDNQQAAENFFASMPEADAKRLAPASSGVPSVNTLAVAERFLAPK